MCIRDRCTIVLVHVWQYNIGGTSKPAKDGATHSAAAVVPRSPTTVTVVDSNNSEFFKQPTAGTVTRRARMASKVEDKNSNEAVDNTNVCDRRAALFARRAVAVDDGTDRGKDAGDVTVPDATSPVAPAARINSKAEDKNLSLIHI